MSLQNNPIALVQNPAFGAHLLWSFCKGFQTEKVDQLSPMLNVFLVLPVLFHQQTLEILDETQKKSGLSMFVSKLSKDREMLIAIHNRALRLREVTLQSMAIGIAAGLLHVDYNNGQLRANELKMPLPPERLKIHVRCADKLGRWFSRMPQRQVFTLLQVYI